MNTLMRLVVVLGLGMLVGGCVSTPAKRIKQEPQVFASFPPEVQALVQNGKIEIGFTRDMVRLAVGRPQQIHTRTTDTGDLEVWSYVNSRYVGYYQPMTTGYWYQDRHTGRVAKSYDTMWVNRGWYEDYLVLRLEFSGDKLKAIERLGNDK
jgi:hypothetical protein